MGTENICSTIKQMTSITMILLYKNQAFEVVDTRSLTATSTSLMTYISKAVNKCQIPEISTEVQIAVELNNNR